MKKELTGGKRMRRLMDSGKITGKGQYLDTYNQAVFDGYAGCIKSRIDQNNMYFVTVVE